LRGYFVLSATAAQTIAAPVGNAISKWRDEATSQGRAKMEIDRMASAFEQRDLEMASGRLLGA
jgi:hypothetical protein